MKSDEEGFWYPEIRQEECINCDLCEKVCPINGRYMKEDFLEEAEIYATYNRDEEKRIISSSGGMFIIYAEHILDQGGVVFGVSFDSSFKVMHKEALTMEGVHEFLGSKYTQSDVGEVYKDVKKYLGEGKKVLFSGTPCQVAALYNYLGKDHENLFTIDLVCHGVFSPKVFNSYLDYVNKKSDNYDIKDIKFRSKLFGWGNYCMHIEYKDGQKYIEKKLEDPFYLLYAYIALRPSCYECTYSKSKREADVSIADYWRVRNHKPHLYDLKGLSLLFNNSKKAQKVFEQTSEKMMYERCTLEEVMQRNLEAPTPKSEMRDEFFESYNKEGFEKTVEKMWDRLIDQFNK